MPAAWNSGNSRLCSYSLLWYSHRLQYHISSHSLLWYSHILLYRITSYSLFAPPLGLQVLLTASQWVHVAEQNRF
jgi:hypothetical protein